jgi:formate dehydrogenase subunit beta
MARTRPDARFAAVLKACEVRALDDLLERDDLSLHNWLIIGIDCLGCFPAQDFEWRAQKAGGVEELTREVLRNARQGGIAIDRFRSACQRCARPQPSHVDLCVDLLGLPVQDAMLVCARSEPFASKLGLAQITAGPAPSDLIMEHEMMLRAIEDRRLRARNRQLRLETTGLPVDLDGLVSFLQACQPCTACLEACPVLSDELIMALDTGMLTRGLVRRWLLSCAECGMCEQACPRGLPIAAAMNRISRDLKLEPIAL